MRFCPFHCTGGLATSALTPAAEAEATRQWSLADCNTFSLNCIQLLGSYTGEARNHNYCFAILLCILVRVLNNGELSPVNEQCELMDTGVSVTPFGAVERGKSIPYRSHCWITI